MTRLNRFDLKTAAAWWLAWAATASVLTCSAAACSSGGHDNVTGTSAASANRSSASSGYSDHTIREKWLAEQAAFYDIEDPPTVDLIRYITVEESQQVYRDCLAEAGFAQDENGGVSVPDDQRSSYNLAGYTCAAEYQLDPAYYRPLTKHQLDILYDYYRDTFIPCAEKLDFDPGDLPSRQVFRSTYGTQQWWAPDLSTLARDKRSAVSSECPEQPPFDVLYG